MDTIRFAASIASIYALVTAVGACGSDSGGGGASCASVCAKVEAAHCANDPDCMSQCADAKNATPSHCNDRYDALAKCFSTAKFTCDDNGQSVATACASRQDAWESCINGDEPDAGAGGSGSGGKGNGNSGSGNTGSGNAGSGGAGSSVTCDGTVWSKPCDVCIATSCCDLLTACRHDTDCLSLSACVTACTDDGCVQTCADNASQATVDQYNESITCASDHCTSECSDGPAGSGGSSSGSSGSSGSGNSGIGAPNDGNEGVASPTTPPDCLPVPSDVSGYCGDVKYKVIYDCPDGPPYKDCVLNTMDSSGIYCCGH